MQAKQLILNKIKDGTFALLTDMEIARRLRLKRQEAYGLRDMLHALVRQGELLCDSQYRYGTAEQFGARPGKLSGNERGFAFFVPDDGSDDLFIPHRRLNGAYHGDSVLCIPVFGKAGDEGEVLAIITRGHSEVVGTFQGERNGGLIVPDEKKLSFVLSIPRGMTKGAKSGDKAVAKITSYNGKMPTGQIVEILGESGDFLTEELSLIRSHGLREEFPAEVVDVAEKQAMRDPDEECKNRADFRDKLIITVDGEDTRDIDDGISVEKKDGKYYLGVHIADVSHYVKQGGVLDEEAFRRGTSVYFPDRVLPMLPTALSNDICSLNEGVTRLTLSCLMTIDAHGRVLHKKIVPSVICSRHRTTYTEITAIYERKKEAVEKYPDLVEFVDTAMELTKLLKRVREARGSVDLDVKEAKILFFNGEIAIPDYERTLSHEMIEQFMVLANESVAELMTKAEVPFVYRVHESPSEEKARDFADFLREAGVREKFDPSSVRPADYANLLNALKGKPIFSVVNRIMLRSMMKAHYSPENVGHFGLASECYCHFTSPIRRYPDLCIHRIIKDALVDAESAKKRYKQTAKDAADRSSLCEKNAVEAERDVDALYIVAYMSKKIGEDYEGTVSGVNSYGVFVELDNTVEGFIPVETLPDDSYEFIESRFLLRGTKRSFRLGERLPVRVAGVDWGLRRVHFVLNAKKESK